MSDQFQTFLNLLFEPDDIIEFRNIKVKTQKQYIREYWGTIAEVLENRKTLEEENKEGFSIFCGINPRKAKQKKGDVNVLTCRAFFVDIDHKDFKHIPWEEFYDFIKDKIKTANLPIPTLDVNSGHGYHLYWILAKSLSVDKWKSVQTGLIEILHADVRCSNPERILRPPGFMNPKYEDAWVKCIIKEFNPDNIYTLQDFKQVGAVGTKQREYEETKNVYNFQIPDILKIIQDEGIQWKKCNKENIYIQCPFAEEYHSGEDTDPSCQLGISGKYKGIYHCFACNKEKAGKVSGTIITILLRHRLGEEFHKLKSNQISDKTKKILNQLNEQYPGLFRTLSDKTFYNAKYPRNIAEKITEKYFTIPGGQPEAGMNTFIYKDEKFYSCYNQQYRHFIKERLNSLLWYELGTSYCKRSLKDKFAIYPFPVNQGIVNSIIDALKAIRDYKFVLEKDYGYTRDEIDNLGNAFWFRRDKGLPNIDNVIVTKNYVIDYMNNNETFDLTPNLFCPTPLPVIYDKSLPKPKRCEKFNKDNFETQPQINEVLKRDAYLCVPKYFESKPAFFIMQGKTGSGKGTNIKFLKALLGVDNYLEGSTESLGEKFGMQDWQDLLALFFSDREEGSTNKIVSGAGRERLKKLSAGDEMDIRLPGGIWLRNVKISAKAVFANPKIQSFESSVEEFIRRVQIATYKKQYSLDKERFPNALDPDDSCLEDMISEKDAYFTHYIIGKGLPLLIKEGFKTTEESRELIQEIREEGNFVLDFYTEYTKEDEAGRILNKKLLRAFHVLCKMKNREDLIRDIKSPTQLTSEIRRNTNIKTDKDKGTHQTFIYNRSFTEQGIELLKKYSTFFLETDF